MFAPQFEAPGRRPSSHRRNKRPALTVIVCIVLYSAALTSSKALDTPGSTNPTDAETPPPPTLSTARELLNEGQYEKAREAFDALTRDSRFGPDARIGLALVDLATGRYEEGIRRLNEFDSGRTAQWHFTMARLCAPLGRYDEVLSHARAAYQGVETHAAARLLEAQTLELLGRRDDALTAYRWFDEQIAGRRDFPRDPAWVTHTALGFLRYSVLTRTNVVARSKHVLTELLQAAYERLDRTYWPARIAAADLLREKFNNDPAHGSISDYRAALKINGNLPEAHVGLGEIALSNWNFEEAEKRAESALAINSNFPPALHLLARKFIVERRYEQAADVAERALTLNPNDLAALSLVAAAASCRFDEGRVAEMLARAQRINPRPALFHRTVGDALSGIRQYAESEAAYRKAMEYDDVDANARTELGMMYMQWGEEEKARNVLEAAFALDPYNERTKFTLDLLSSLEKFARHETKNFIVHYDSEKDAGLGEFVAEYLEEIYEPVTRDFFTPLEEKTIIEIFPTAAAFGVRITGRPWIPTVGACSGRVIALATPRPGEDRLGRYNLARVLKHEFTHTVTLAATRNRIPHWFTEGLAVYQEDAPRGFTWSQLLAEAVRRDELFTLQSIDWGFMRPRRPNDRQMAYAQSEWMCEFIVERFGYDVIQKMLEGYHAGRTQPRVLEETLGISPDEFDAAFRRWAREQAGRWGFDLTPPADVEELREQAGREGAGAEILGRLARAELDARDGQRALAAAEKALELDENNVDGLEVLCIVRGEKSKSLSPDSTRREAEDDLIPLLRRLGELQPKGWTSPRLLSEILLRRKEFDAAEEHLKRLQALCPMDPLSWRGLSGIYLERGNDAAALPQLLELARQEEHDPSIARSLAAIHRKNGRLKEAQFWYRQSIFIDPFSAESHQALGEVSMQSGDAQAALKAFEMWTKLNPTVAKSFEAAAFAAQKLGRSDQSLEFARRAVQLDPQNPAKALLP